LLLASSSLTQRLMSRDSRAEACATSGRRVLLAPDRLRWVRAGHLHTQHGTTRHHHGTAQHGMTWHDMASAEHFSNPAAAERHG
jgi:hypothetical protein